MRIASGMKWSALSQMLRVGSQLLGIFILARLLPPSDFGLVAMASLVIGFANIFRDFGTVAAIIQKPQPSPLLLDSIYWLNLFVGIGLASVVAAFARFIADWFGEARVADVLWAMLLIFPITNLGGVHQALHEKISDFRSLAIIESISAVTGLVVAIIAASSGFGVYSLVLQSLIAALLTTTGLWMSSGWRPRLCWDGNEVRTVIGFGGNLTGFHIVNYFIRNADNLLIGRFLGATELGYYSFAYRLMLWPVQNISSVVGRVLFPALSRLQSDKRSLADAYLGATASVALITAPLMLGFFVLREPFVMLVLGERWEPVIEVLAWLVPVGLIQSINTTVGTLYMSTGRTDVMVKWIVVAGCIVVPAFAIGLNWGITGVAAAYAIVSLLLLWPSLAIPFRLIGLKVGDLILRLRYSILSAAFMAMVIIILGRVLPIFIDSATLRLALLIISGVMIYVSINLYLQRPLLYRLIRVASDR
jgi:PST family polysaccharide transporter